MKPIFRQMLMLFETGFCDRQAKEMPVLLYLLEFSIGSQPVQTN